MRSDEAKGKRMSFTNLAMDSPTSTIPVPRTGKKMSFTDLADGTESKSINFDAGFFEDSEKDEEDGSPIPGEYDEESAEESQSDDDDDDDDDSPAASSQQKKVVIVEVKVPSNARVGQIVNVRYYDRMYNVAIPRQAIGKEKFKTKIEIDLSNPEEGKAFVHGYGLYRQTRAGVFKMWKHVYLLCTPRSLVVYKSERDYRDNTGIIDDIHIHSMCEIGKMYAKEDRASKRKVWQMKILENDPQTNRDAIRDLGLWKMDPRLPITERIKIGAVEGESGKLLLVKMRTMLQDRVKKLQQINLARSCVKNM